MSKITYTVNGRPRTIETDARPRSLLGWVWAVVVAVGRWVWD